MIRLIRRLIARDRRAKLRILPPLAGPRRQLRAEIEEAERRCQCQRVGELRKRMRDALHEELKRELGR